MEEDVANIVIKTLRAYLHEELPLDKGFFSELDGQDLLASDTARELAQLANHGKRDCVWNLVIYMEEFYTEEMLLRLCVFLEEYAQPARHKLAVIASRIRQEISKHKPQAISLPVPKDPLHRSVGAQDDVEVLFPVITPLKQKFSELVSKVFVVISKLNEERMEQLHSYLTTLLTPSGGQGMPRHVRHARLPTVPKPVDELKEFLRVKWDELNIQVLESIVNHLKDDKLTRIMTNYQQTLSREGSKPLSECPVKTVQPHAAPEETLVSVKSDQSPDQQTLGDVFSLRNFICGLGIKIPAIFRGFKHGCTVLYFSIPTECVWSLPSCLLPSNLSLLEEWKVLSLSVKGAFTVYIKERRVGIDSFDKHSLLLSLSEYKTYIVDRVQQMEKEEESRVMDEGTKLVLLQLHLSLMSLLQHSVPLNLAGSQPQRQAQPRDGDKPSSIELLDAVIPKVAADWEVLSIMLKLEDKGRIIAANYAKVEDRCRHILKAWTDGEGRKPVTWETLLEVMGKCGYKDLADELAERLKRGETLDK